MKSKYTASMLISTLLLVPVTVGKTTSESTLKNEATVQVDFADPSRFLDVDLDGLNTGKGRQIVLNKIQDVFRKEGQKRLPSGYRLYVQVSDIDLAGSFEPWRLPENNVRFDRRIYPPRISFQYEIADDRGEIVAVGEERLKDLDYLFSPVRSIRRGSEVAHDVSELIRDWMKGPLSRKLSRRAS